MFVIGLVTFGVATGQEKKNEQKIKIIVNDGSGTKVVIDTLITDGHMQDSITLKDGKVIFIGHPGDDHEMKHSDNKDQVYVYVTTEDNTNQAVTKTITVVSSDSAVVKHAAEGGKVIVMSSGAPSHSNETFDVYVTKDDMVSSEYSTRSIIAKDGLVVTVEGNDEVKVKELVKEIQKKMGVNPPASEKKETVNTETKKTTKK